MADHTHIQWSQATLNVVTGCQRVSEGCLRCYIERTPPFRMAGRKFDSPEVGGATDVQLHPDRLLWPLKWRKPRRIFVNSLSDLWHDDVPDELIHQLWAVMAATPQHTYQILTKRPARMRSVLTDVCRCGAGHASGVHFRSAMEWAATAHSPTYVPGLTSVYHRAPWPLPNVWVCASVESQKWADIRIPQLVDTPAAVLGLSCEPLLGPLDITRWLPRLGWVIVGGESGPDARPMDPAWVRSLVDQCTTAGVPVFVKQLGSVWARDASVGGVSVSRTDPKGGDPQYWPRELRIREYPQAVTVGA